MNSRLDLPERPPTTHRPSAQHLLDESIRTTEPGDSLALANQAIAQSLIDMNSKLDLIWRTLQRAR